MTAEPNPLPLPLPQPMEYTDNPEGGFRCFSESSSGIPCQSFSSSTQAGHTGTAHGNNPSGVAVGNDSPVIRDEHQYGIVGQGASPLQEIVSPTLSDHLSHELRSLLGDGTGPDVRSSEENGEVQEGPNEKSVPSSNDLTSESDSPFSNNSDPFPANGYFSNVHNFLQSHSDIVEFWLKHKVSAMAMDDLLKMRQAPITTWKGVTYALYESEDIHIQSYPMCSEGHMALSAARNGTIEKCQSKSECKSPVTHFSYISLWERLRIRLQSPVFGPEMFEHHHSELDKIEHEDEVGAYDDFYSGSIFRDYVKRVGGTDAVRHDIFLFISGDGAQPYKSSLYDYWPVVALIGNLTPAKRVNTRNLLPVTCIPGPNEPQDLVSFLHPLIEELKLLAKGVECQLWDGRHVKVRVHLLFLLADLPAMAKLCRVKGSNGYSPCRFCLIVGIVSTRGNTMYYPSYLVVNEEVVRRMELNSPELRCVSETRESIRDIEKLRRSTERGSVGMMKDMCMRTGINGQSQLFHSLRSLEPYRSCPIDIMHLLLLNIPGNMVDLFYVEGIITSTIEKMIDDALVTFGDGLISETRRPKKLKYRKMFKAADWRFFILQSSLIVFHELLPDDILDGWFVFVQVVELSFRTHLSIEDTAKLGELSVQFYKFVEERFYQGDLNQVGVCKYTMHLLLHLEECTRNCGPLANLSQFPMERFVGEMKNGLKAKHLAAESVMEQWRLLESYKSFVIRNAVDCNSYGGTAFKPAFYTPRASLSARSEMADFDEVVYCHPFRRSSVSEYETTEPEIRSLLQGFYMRRLGLSSEAAQELVQQNEAIGLWERMAFNEAFEEESRVSHFGIWKSNYKPGARRNCYVAAEFVSDSSGPSSSSNTDNGNSPQHMLVYYGQVARFISHDVRRMDKAGSDRYMLVLVDWVVRGLRKGRQNQVFATLRREDSKLFSERGLEGADVVCRHISVVEKAISTRSRRKHRTYFADPNLLRDRLLEPLSSKQLQGTS